MRGVVETTRGFASNIEKGEGGLYAEKSKVLFPAGVSKNLALHSACSNGWLLTASRVHLKGEGEGFRHHKEWPNSFFLEQGGSARVHRQGREKRRKGMAAHGGRDFATIAVLDSREKKKNTHTGKKQNRFLQREKDYASLKGGHGRYGRKRTTRCRGGGVGCRKEKERSRIAPQGAASVGKKK